MVQFLISSKEHSSQVGLIRNLKIKWVLPQYHVVYNNIFKTIPSITMWCNLDVHTNYDSCTELFDNGHDLYLDDEVNYKGRLIPIPELRNYWISREELE